MRRKRIKVDQAVTSDEGSWSEGMEQFYSLNLKYIWAHFLKESFAFKMICMYVAMEYFRPQDIYKGLDFLPWTQIFLILALFALLTEKNKKSTSHPASIFIVLLLIAILLSCQFAYHPSVSWQYIDLYYIWAIIYFLIINIVNTKERFFIFLMVFILGSLKMSLSGFKTLAMRGFSFASWGLSGPGGPFSNSGEYAIQMLIFTFISFHLLTLLKPYLSKNYFRLLMFLAPFTAALSVLGSSSRGSQLALLCCALYYFKSKIKFKNIIIFSILLTLSFHFLPEEQKLRFSEMGQDETSQQRLMYWKNGIDMWKNNMFTGVGHYNFIPYYNDHYQQDLLLSSAELAHNIFIQILADLGLIGFIPYLILILYGFIWKKKDKGTISQKMALGFNSAFLGYLIAGQFVTVAYYPFMWIHISMVICLKNLSVSPKRKNNKRSVKQTNQVTVDNLQM